MKSSPISLLARRKKAILNGYYPVSIRNPPNLLPLDGEDKGGGDKIIRTCNHLFFPPSPSSPPAKGGEIWFAHG
jgi:hypothetical protein